MTVNESQSNPPQWTWNALGTPPSEKKPMSMKTKACIQAPIMALVAWALYHFRDHRVVPMIIWSLAGLVLIGGLFIPPLFLAFEKFGRWLGKWVTVILNWVLLVPFYYLCFLPGRIILLIRGKDPMDREFPSNRESFWIPRKQITDMKQYRKQH